MKTSLPPGRRSRAASATNRSGSIQIEAPYSETTRSKLVGASPVAPASASTSGNSIPVSAMHPPRRLELGGGDVDADRPRALPREHGREVGGPAAELDDVEPGDVPEHAELGLGDRPRSPR